MSSSSSSSTTSYPVGDIKGLHNFIVDLRKCRSKEAEGKRINKELANIRSKFKGDKAVSGYDKKKYVCKLLYMFLLGIDIGFGHIEAVSLLSSLKYSEKMIGYLFLSVMLTEDGDMSRLIIQSIKSDLLSRHETHVCLALGCLANMGGREMAGELSQEVAKLLIATDSASFIKKKAALCMLRLTRKAPDCLPHGEYTARIIKNLNHEDIAVVSSTASLVLNLIDSDPSEYASARSAAIQRLVSIQRMERVGSYLYYRVPDPWCQVKLLQIIQKLDAPPQDSKEHADLVQYMKRVLQQALETPIRDRQNKKHESTHFNARNSVLYEVIVLLIAMDSERPLIVDAIRLLGKFLGSKETNLRYLALELMAMLTMLPFALDSVRAHQDTVIASLHQERDISVRRRALDLLYNLSNESNSRVITNELLEHLKTADYEIREDLVMRIAVVAEKYPRDPSWYFDVIMQLLTQAGENVSDEVWQRVCQIVTNKTDVQDYATRTVFDVLESQQDLHESMIKVAAYVLGEFGHLIANDPRSSPHAQFAMLRSKFALSTQETRAILLTAFVKQVNLFPELRDTFDAFMGSEQMTCNANVEIQQRVIEYRVLSRLNDDLIQTVLEEMPVYEDSPSSLLSKINDMAAVRPAVAASAASARDRRRTPNHPGSATAGGIAGPPARNGSVVAVSGASASAPAPAAAAVASAPIVDIFGDEPAATPAPTEVAITADAATVTPGTEKWSTRFITNNDGVLYEDGLLQVGVKSSFKGALGQVALYFGNRSPSTLDGFNVSIHMGSAMSKLKLSTSPAPDRSVPAGKQVNTIVKIECIADFADSPIVAVGFSIAGRAFSINLALPILLHKFCHPVEAMDQAVFSTRWKALSLAGLESQQIVQAKADINLEVVKKHIEGLGLGVIAGIDRNPTNFVGVGILHTTAGQVGVLLRLEPNLEGKMFRLTIRASKEGIATVLTERLATVL